MAEPHRHSTSGFSHETHFQIAQAKIISTSFAAFSDQLEIHPEQVGNFVF